MTDDSPLPNAQTQFADQLTFRSQPAEDCTITQAVNRICYTDIAATMDSPPYARAIVEGFLVNTSDTEKADENTPISFQIKGEILPGDEIALTPALGEGIKISTGSIIPEGAFSAVRPWEAKVEGETFSISRPLPPRFFIEEQGCEQKKGDVLVPKGASITAKHIGLCASMGINDVSVAKKVQVALFSSGDEVIPHTKSCKPGQIFDANSPMLSAAIHQAGGIPINCGIQPDDFDNFVLAAKKALAESDMLLISGGTAIGGRDFISDLIKSIGELIIDGVPMRSGRPLIMGTADGKPIVCVAGYPPEALRGFQLFGQLAINISHGHSQTLPES